MLNNVKKIMAIALGIASLFIIFLPTKAKAATINVPGDYATIQAGIDAAQCGDTVLVAPGTYFENPTFGVLGSPNIGRGITLQSSGGAGVTTINGGGSGHVVLVLAYNTTIDGFTITNSGGSFYGGIFLTKSSARIINNIVSGNNGSQAISISSDSFAYIWGNTINQNRVPISSGAIRIVGSSADIRNNVIYSNTGAVGATGISLACISTCLVLNNTIDDHEYGVYIDGPNSIIRNNIISNNQGFGIHYDATPGLCPPIASDVFIAYNDVFNNSIRDYNCFDLSSGDQPFAPDPGTGEISLDPLYVNPAIGDYTLQGGSLAIDAGDPAPAFNDVDTSRNDMGAFGGNYSLPTFSCSSLLIPTVGEWGYIMLGLFILATIIFNLYKRRIN